MVKYLRTRPGFSRMVDAGFSVLNRKYAIKNLFDIFFAVLFVKTRCGLTLKRSFFYALKTNNC